MNNVVLYSREITRRVAVNRFGKMGYQSYIEFVAVSDCHSENEIADYNKRKRIKFTRERDPKYIAMPAAQLALATPYIVFDEPLTR